MKKKQTISLLLALILFCGLIPRLALSANADNYSGTCGENLLWTFVPNNGTLTISGSGNMSDYTWGGQPWESLKDEIKHLVVESGVRSITASAFENCSNLFSVDLPNSVVLIGSGAFADCSSLEMITLPVSLTEISYESFTRCSSLTSIIIPDGVTSIGDRAFDGCSSLADIALPNSLLSIGNSSFMGCESLSSINIPNSVVEIGGWAFFDCSNLTSVEIPYSVTSIGFAPFSFCDNLKNVSVDPENLCYCNDEYGVLYDKEMKLLIQFPPAQQIESYTIPSTVQTIGNGGAFSNCNSLKSITLPDSVSYIGSNAFDSCYGLTTIIVPNSVEIIGNAAFQHCTGLTSISIPDNVASIGLNAFSMCFNLISVRLPSAIEVIQSYTFADCRSLTNIIIPDNVHTIGYSAFRGCTSLANVALSDNSITTIKSYAFDGCDSLKQIVIPSSVSEIGEYAFGFYYYYYTNYDADILEVEHLKTNGFTIYGYSETAAQEYADINGFSFVNLTENPCALGHNFIDGVCSRCGKKQTAHDMFTDVKDSAYYADAVLWAVQNGVTSGTGAGTFSPKDTCTRAQIVTFLYCAAGKPEHHQTESPFSDVKPGKWYYDAVMWAYENEITGGVGDGLFGVHQGCTRGQAMTFLWKSLGCPEPETEDCPFTDVKPGKYYYKPVLWALENGITSGTGETTFGTGDTCTRAQIVTFLYKVYGNE